jgi:hypothetical protein
MFGTMNEDQRIELAAKLATAKDSEMVREIASLGESFLKAQLQSGLASDSRALTLAAVLAAVSAAILGGGATLVAAKISVWPHILSLAVFCGAAIVALLLAIYAARPTKFGYPGNNPKHWADDVVGGVSLKSALAEQASFYAKNIEINAGILRDNQRYIRRALWTTWIGLLSAIGLEIVIVLWLIGKHGFSAVLGG